MDQKAEAARKIAKGGFQPCKKECHYISYGIITYIFNAIVSQMKKKHCLDYVKSEPHIILGTNKDGNPIYFTRVGVLNDVLEWGMDVGDIVDLINGKTTWKDIAKRMPKKALQKTIDMISPFYKTPPFELFNTKKLFPDATNPTHMR